MLFSVLTEYLFYCSSLCTSWPVQTSLAYTLPFQWPLQHRAMIMTGSNFHCFSCILVPPLFPSELAFFIFLHERYLTTSFILLHLRPVETMPSRAGALSSMLPPLISVAAIKVSNCLCWALQWGKFSLPPSESWGVLFLRTVKVFLEITNAIECGVIP